MLAKSKFFVTPSEVPHAAARSALLASQVVGSVNDVFCRVDPDQGNWFGIIVPGTDLLPTLLNARERLPNLRAITERRPEMEKISDEMEGVQAWTERSSTELARRVLA